jgi:hypothetical protein
MLDRNERQFFSGDDVTTVLGSIQNTLWASGVQLAPSGPNAYSGRGQVASFGMMPKVGVSVMPIQGGFFVDVRVSPDFESGALVILVVSWFFFFPIAIILAVLGYQDWQGRQNQLFAALWSPVASRMAQAPTPQWGYVPPAR